MAPLWGPAHDLLAALAAAAPLCAACGRWQTVTAQLQLHHHMTPWERNAWQAADPVQLQCCFVLVHQMRPCGPVLSWCRGLPAVHGLAAASAQRHYTAAAGLGPLQQACCWQAGSLDRLQQALSAEHEAS